MVSRWSGGMLACATLASLAVGASEGTGGPAKTYAQRLVDWVVEKNADVIAAELAVVSDSGCATLAATDPEDVGETCDEDEQVAMRGTPNVERPSGDEEAYDITQALHDASGRLIGAVGFDLVPPRGATDSVMVARARAVLAELEARIPSRASLSEAADALPRPDARTGLR